MTQRNMLRVVFGERDGSHPAVLDEIAEVMRKSGITVVVSDHILRDCFQKYALIAPLATVGSYYNANTGEIRDDKEKLEKGIELEDGMTYPAVIKDVPDAAYTYSITIHEGRHRQVKRMFASVGHEVKTLKRIRIGRLELGDLAEGEIKKLTQAEIGKLLRR